MTATVSTSDDTRASALRAFNRFWTGMMGLLDQGLLQSRFSLTEARVLFELAQADELETTVLRDRTRLDAGHLSRILARFDDAGLVTRSRSALDARRQVGALTTKGRAAAETLDERSQRQARAVLGPLPVADQDQLLSAMATIRRLTGDTTTGAGPATAFIVREPRPGDLGWVVQRHGSVYADEYGWDHTFEALVARIVGDFGAGHDPHAERAWIAELDGRPVGCVFCVRKDVTTAQLRLLLVDPAARGSGLGAQLVRACVYFAVAAGYSAVVLWTNDVLTTARRIYQAAGFELVDEESHHSFGRDLVGQHWRLELGAK